MHRIFCPAQSPRSLPLPAGPLLWLGLLLASASTPSANAASTAGQAAPLVSATPMRLNAAEGGVHGELVVSPEIVSPDSRADLIFTITREPVRGRVGLAGGGAADFFETKISRLGYFAYRAADDYAGEDSFTYTVRNETTGRVFENRVELSVTPAPPLTLQAFEVTAERTLIVSVREVILSTRPNIPVGQKLPNHEDFMIPADRATITDAKIAYLLDDQSRPRHGAARLDRATGQLSYAPDPGFIGEDRFAYYTVDENNPGLGVENTVTINVEPIRTVKNITADRSRSREVDLVFVINNSRSMAPHQNRIATNLARFRQLFDARDLDYRIAVLTTDFVGTDRSRASADQRYYKEVRSVQLDHAGHPVLDDRGRPLRATKRVSSNGQLVTLPVMDQPWVTPATPPGVFAELVRVGTRGDSNRTAFTAVYNFVAASYNNDHALLRPAAPTIVVFFMDEEETRMATWRDQPDGPPTAEWIQNGELPRLIDQYNRRHPTDRQTLDGYINTWVRRPFIIAKGNKRGTLEIHAVVTPDNLSHRRAAELTGGTVMNIESDFSAPLAALGDRIAETVAVALAPVDPGATLYEKSLRVLADGTPLPADPTNGYVYDELTHRIHFHGEAKQQAFTALIDITYEEHR